MLINGSHIWCVIIHLCIIINNNIIPALHELYNYFCCIIRLCVEYLFRLLSINFSETNDIIVYRGDTGTDHEGSFS